MILWRIKLLVQRLQSRPMSSREIRAYVSGAVIACALLFVGADWSRPWDRDEFEALVDSTTTVLNGLVSVIGVAACYRANGREEGVEFVNRLLALGFVLGIRFFVFTALGFVVWAYATLSLNLPFRPSYETLDVCSVLLVCLFWWRLRDHISAVARVRSAA